MWEFSLRFWFCSLIFGAFALGYTFWRRAGEKERRRRKDKILPDLIEKSKRLRKIEAVHKKRVAAKSQDKMRRSA